MINIEQSNIALLGSDLEKEVRATSAACEAEWKKTGKPGFFKWRIINFKVVPDEDKNTFYSGDSYIVLMSKKLKGDAIKHDIHFWQGEKSSQDEIGVSAYKAQELDTYLGTSPTQHRECQNYESNLFLSYFENFIVLEGGVDSGFNHVKPTEYRPRLLHVKGTVKTICVREVELSPKSVNSGDVFLLDLGKTVIQFQGRECSGFERAKTAQVVRAIDDQRGSDVEIITFSEDDKDYPEQWLKMVGKGPYKSAAEGGSDKLVAGKKKLFRVSDASGKIEVTLLAEDSAIKRSMVTSDDAFIYYTGYEVFVYVGLKASDSERKNVFGIAREFIKKEGLPEHIAVHRMLEGGENEIFEEAFV